MALQISGRTPDTSVRGAAGRGTQLARRHYHVFIAKLREIPSRTPARTRHPPRVSATTRLRNRPAPKRPLPAYGHRPRGLCPDQDQITTLALFARIPIPQDRVTPEPAGPTKWITSARSFADRSHTSNSVPPFAGRALRPQPGTPSCEALREVNAVGLASRHGEECCGLKADPLQHAGAVSDGSPGPGQDELRQLPWIQAGT